MRGAVLLLFAMAPLPGRAQDAPRPPALQEAFAASDRVHVSLAFSPDSKRLALGGASFIRVLEIPPEGRDRFAEIKVLGQRGLVDEAAFEPGGRALLSRSRDVDTFIWDTRTWASIRIVINNHVGDLQGLARSGPWLAFPNRGRGIRLWGLEGIDDRRRTLRRYDLTEAQGISFDRITAVAVGGPDLFLGDEEGRLVRTPIDAQISAQTDPLPNLSGEALGQERKRPPAPAAVVRAHRGAVLSVSVTPDARFCVTAGADGQVRLWSADQISLPKGDVAAPARRVVDPKPKWSIPGCGAELCANGALLAVAEPKGLAVYDVESGNPVSWNPTAPRRGRIVRVRFSPDGRYIAGILCACAECSGMEVVAPVRRRFQEHGGTLLVWK